MEVQEKDGKYVLTFDTRQEAELHAEALKKSLETATAPTGTDLVHQQLEQTKEPAEHEGLGEKFKHLVARLKRHGIADADAPLTDDEPEEVDLGVSNPGYIAPSAPEEEATPGPIATELETVKMPAAPQKAGTAAASSGQVETVEAPKEEKEEEK